MSSESLLLLDKPAYEVLSYRWGDPAHRASVTVDNAETFVTPNLHAALIRLRRQDQKRTIWINQLCIDQSNIEERISQVHLMRDIYSNCTKCVIWLDEIDPEVVPRADAESIVDVLSWMAKGSLPTPPCIASASAFQGPIKALGSIGVDKRPWWCRIWTVKEAILPAKKLLVWGPLSITWELLTLCTHAWLSAGTPNPAIAQLRNLVSRGASEVWSDACKVFDLLFCNVPWINTARGRREPPLKPAMKWRWRKAAEPNDNVFGLLGLSSPGVKLGCTAQCDYDTPTVEPFCAFTLDLVLEEGLLILSVEPRAWETNGTKGIARWAHDMDCEMSHRVDQFYRCWGYSSYDACAGRELDQSALRKEVDTG